MPDDVVDIGADIDRQQILLLAKIDPAVGACIKLWSSGEITFERALIMAVTDLALQLREYRSEMKKIKMTMPVCSVPEHGCSKKPEE